MDKSLPVTSATNHCTTAETATASIKIAQNTSSTIIVPSSRMETSTTTISTVSSNTKPHHIHPKTSNPFSTSENSKTEIDLKTTEKHEEFDNIETTAKTSSSTGCNQYPTPSLPHQLSESNNAKEFTNTNMNCDDLSREFEKLNSSTLIGTESETTLATATITTGDSNESDSNSSGKHRYHANANKQEFEGTVNPDIDPSYCFYNSNISHYCSSTLKSSPNPFVTLTALTTSLTTTTNNLTNLITNELANRMISKCLSQSSSTTTITSSSSRTSSVLIESPSLTMPPPFGSMSMSPSSSPPPPPPPPPLSQSFITITSNCNNNNNNNQSLTNFPIPLSSPPSSPLPPIPKIPATPHIRILPKLHSLDLADEHCIHIDQDDVDADIDDDNDSRRTRAVATTTSTTTTILAPGHRKLHDHIHPSSYRRGEVLQTRSEEDDRDETRAQLQLNSMKHSKSELTAASLNSPPKGMMPKIQATMDSRPIYPNVPYSPYGSPYGSPRSNRRRTPLRESRRISIEQSGSFLQLNQYKLMDQIGQGSYGLVKLAYSEEDSTHYAMKILSKRRLLRKAGLMGRGPKRTTSPLDRVYREIAVLKKLDHPNVVKLVEVLDDPLEDSLYLVFELVQQGEVLNIPTDRPLSEERAWCVFRDALQGLEYLHYQRIIHADIKPGNLLLGECGRVKIADLGVCNEFLGEDAAMNNGSTAGTPAFRAPETLIPGQHLYSGKAADIWALGATLYALVYGNVPFVAKSVPALYEKIKHDQLKFPEFPKISSELRDLIEKILTKDPSKRITLPQIKEHPWVTSNGAYPLPSEEENCRLVQISDEDIHTVVKSIPKLDTLILIKTMLKNHSFQNPFSRGVSGRAPQRGGSRLERFTRSGRSNSAPGAYHLSERQLSSENILPSVSEGVASSCNESSDQSVEG